MPCRKCSGMFSTHSSVAQLKPETVFHSVNEAENQMWSQGDLPKFSVDSSPTGPTSLGSLLLSQSQSIKKIHNYFSQLESRKCCLHLACKRSTFNSLRVVPSCKTRDDGSAKKKQLISDFSYLEPKEMRAFKHAYLCAVYPVLAAPDPPASPGSPSQMVRDQTRSPHTPYSSVTAAKIAANVFPDNQSQRSLSPYSLHDSGMEESEEAGLIPMESLCEQLRRSFVLTHCVFQQYESIIIKTYSKKSSPQRVHPFTLLLAEEFSGQLALLETNGNPFYSPSTFVTQNGYDLWQKQERINISKLLSKFWHSSLPQPKDTHDLKVHLENVHEHYTILLKKLLNYERRCKQENGTDNDDFTPLSSTSNRLLLEFGLRFGIGEVFRKVIFLECLTSEFSLSVGYLSLVNNLVYSIHQLLPGKKSTIVMVKDELEILQSSLRTLKVQTCKALSQMKRLFPGNKPAKGIELLMSVLKVVLELMKYLAPSGINVPLFESCLKMTVQSIFQSNYEMFKTVSRSDLANTGRTDTDPRLLNILIQDIREDVTDYRANFEGTFQNYFSISQMAATAYYQLLMDDVKLLTESGIQHQPLVEIDLRMLALAYRLNQLDFDWKQYIAPQRQTWRAYFLSTLTQLTSALRLHLQNLVLETVANDKYTSQNLNLPMPFSTYQSLHNSLDNPSRSVSAKSITPSLNSAFSSIITSAKRNSPHQHHSLANGNPVLMKESIPENDNEKLTSPNSQQNLEAETESQTALDLDSRSLNLNDVVVTKDIMRRRASRRLSLPECLDSLSSDGLGDSNEVFQNHKKTKKIKITFKKNANGCVCDSNGNNVNEANGGKLSDEDEVSEFNECNEPNFYVPANLSDQENSDKEESASVKGPYEFPPLKLDSESSQSRDFSHPVFTKPPSTDPNATPTPQNKCSNFILRADAPISMSSKASSMVDNWDPYSYNVEQEFSDSLESNVSFPDPPLTRAMLPISGSTVDLLIILQRLCSFSQTLVSTMITNSPFIVDNSTPSKAFPSSLQSSLPFVRNRNEEHKKSNSPCNCKTCTSSSGYRITRQISVNSNQFDRENNSSQRTTPHSAVLETSFNQDRDVPKADYPLFDGRKIKLSIHLRLLKAMCNMTVVYTSNMLCMDLCGTPRNVAIRLIGPQLLELTECQQKSGLIWGCRHQAEDSHDCLFYLHRKTKYLCDRYEPVSQYMCTRINNTSACIEMLGEYQEKLSKSMKVDAECKTPSVSLSDDTAPSIGKDFLNSIANDNVKENNSGRLSDDAMSNSSNFTSSIGSVDAAVIKDQHASFSNQAVEAARQHSMAILSAMCRLLAYKLNLFVRDGLPILIQLKDSRITMATALDPITSFLQKYLDSMSTWLYRSCFRRVLDSLWVLMVQDFESQAEVLKKKGSSAYGEAHNWMLAISHLIKFMNNSGRGIKKELLLSQANDVIFRLHLFTLSTSHLISLYQNLREYYTEGDHLTLEENRLRSPPSILHRIHNELQSLRKCFTGAELVSWIMKNKDALPADLALPPGPVVRDTAITISQVLLDQQFIVDIDSESRAGNRSPDSLSSAYDPASPFPPLSIHSRSTSEHMKHQSQDDCEKSRPQLHSAVIRQLSVADTANRDNDNLRVSPGAAIVEVHRDAETNLDEESLSNGTIGVTNDEIVDKQKERETWLESQYSSSLSEEFLRNAVKKSLQEEGRRVHSDSIGSDSLFMDHSSRQTPFASLDSIYNSNIQRFMPSSSRFYLIHQSILNPSLPNHGGGMSHHHSHLSMHNKTSNGMRGNRESLALMEQCIVHKISPLTVLTIIVSRRKTDVMAKNFIKKVPNSVREKALESLDEPFMGCRSS